MELTVVVQEGSTRDTHRLETPHDHRGGVLARRLRHVLRKGEGRPRGGLRGGGHMPPQAVLHAMGVRRVVELCTLCRCDARNAVSWLFSPTNKVPI